MQEKKIVKIIENENGSITCEGSDDIYTRLFIRSLYLKVLSLSVGRHDTYKGDFFSEPFDSELCLNGKAVVEKDSISIIGDRTHNIKKLHVRISGIEISNLEGPGDSKLKDKIVSSEENQEYEELKCKKASKEGFNQMHTVYLGFIPGDTEIGSKDRWFIDIKIPKKRLLYLVKHFRASRINRLGFFLRLDNVYVKNSYSHMPISWPATWYLRPNISDGDARFPETGKGHVESISIVENRRRLGNSKLAHKHNTDCDKKISDKNLSKELIVEKFPREINKEMNCEVSPNNSVSPNNLNYEEALKKILDTLMICFDRLNGSIKNMTWLLIVVIIIAALIHK